MSSDRVWKPHPQAILSLALLVLFAYMIYEGWGWPQKTKLFPIIVAVPMVGLALFQLTKDLTRRVSVVDGESATSASADIQRLGLTDDTAVAASSKVQEDAEEGGIDKASGRQIAVTGVQLLAYFVGMYLIGFLEVIPLYAALYLRFAAREPWWRAVVHALAIWAFTWGLFSYVLHMPFTSGVLVDLIHGLIQ